MGRQLKETEQAYIRISQYKEHNQNKKNKIEQLMESFACKCEWHWSQFLAKIKDKIKMPSTIDILSIIN